MSDVRNATTTPASWHRAISLRPIDVGFDLRLQKMLVEITPEMVEYGVVYADHQGRDCFVRGSRDQVARALESAGFMVAQEG
jgi:hypothetical protein